MLPCFKASGSIILVNKSGFSDLRKGSASKDDQIATITETNLLFPHRIGCSPAHSCTKAENWEWGLSAWVSFPSAGFSVMLVPQVVVLELKLALLAENKFWCPAHAPLGSNFARPESRSTSLSSFSTSARSFSRAPRWDWNGRAEALVCSKFNCGIKEQKGVNWGRHGYSIWDR